MSIRAAIFNFLMAAAGGALLLQCVIDSSIVNVASCCIVFISSWTVLLYLRTSTALQHHPLSSFALFGFCVSSQLGALLVQTSAWTALSDSLYDPLFTFGTLALYQGIALLVHGAYRFFSVRKPQDVHLIRGMLGWAGLYDTPRCGALWFMGFVGLPTFAFWNYEGVIGKIVLGFTFLSWSPFLIPFYRREQGTGYCNLKLQLILLSGYTFLVALLGVALNARGIMLAGAATVGMLYLLAGMRSEQILTGRSLRRFVTLTVVLGALSIPLSDLATAMVIARGARGKVPASVMIKTTLRIWRQPAVIAAYRAQQASATRYSSYDEHYIANPMLGRLVETKFYDNAFHFARLLKTEEAKSRLQEVSEQFIWVGFPQPVLTLLGIKVDKDQFNYSMGDYLAYLARGIPLGGRKTGNMFAQGIALFGPVFPFLYAVICLGLFAVMDLLTIRVKDGPARICALGLLEIWSFFMSGVSYESLHKVLTFFFRYFPQMLIIYLGVFACARMFGTKRQPDPIVRAAPPPWVDIRLGS